MDNARIEKMTRYFQQAYDYLKEGNRKQAERACHKGDILIQLERPRTITGDGWNIVFHGGKDTRPTIESVTDWLKARSLA